MVAASLQSSGASEYGEGGCLAALQKVGALQLTTSTYLLPDRPAHYEHFQWLTKLIRDSGGDATLVRVREIEGLPNEKTGRAF